VVITTGSGSARGQVSPASVPGVREGLAPAVAAVRVAVRRILTEVRPVGVLVACSGGADSVALAAATAFEAPRLGIPAGLVTVDHGLQDGSAQWAAETAELGRALGLDPVLVRPVTVGTDGGPEAAARTARYAALSAAADTATAAASTATAAADSATAAASTAAAAVDSATAAADSATAEAGSPAAAVDSATAAASTATAEAGSPTAVDGSPTAAAGTATAEAGTATPAVGSPTAAAGSAGAAADSAGAAADTAAAAAGSAGAAADTATAAADTAAGPDSRDAGSEQGGGWVVLLAHTLDDQAETVLLGLGRGSGPRSIAGMRPVDGRWLRPLLGIRRATTRAACAAEHLAYREDPQNADRRFTRVRLRHEVLPLLEDVLHGGTAEALARTAELLRDDLDALDALAATLTPDGTVLDATALGAHPRAVRTRVLRRWVGASLTAVQLHALDALVADWHGQGPVSLPSGREVRRASGMLLLARTSC
jgi:tRNA(Ile)-lysidine synthase